MKTFLSFLTSLIILVSLAPTAEATRVLNKEGVIGATAGGVAGGVIGHQSGNKTEGAILGSVTGYAIGTTLHRQKQRQKQLERERTALRHVIQEQQKEAVAAASSPPVQSAPAEPRYTASERQQLLLQATPLFSVKRSD